MLFKKIHILPKNHQATTLGLGFALLGIVCSFVSWVGVAHAQPLMTDLKANFGYQIPQYLYIPKLDQKFTPRLEKGLGSH